jgi:diphthamide synthase (EF-2-diphthine--ammonia ligase)
MHAVRESLLQQQADALRLPLRALPIPYPCSNDEYQRIMGEAVRQAVADGFTHVAFGDLFLQDIRQYRERQLAGTGLMPLFPLFGQDTAVLARDMIAGGLKARLTCIDPRVLDRRFASREYDEALLHELPADIDPCGERGEFHTFAYDGPMFDRPISIAAGEIVERDGFVFADLLPVDVPA